MADETTMLVVKYQGVEYPISYGAGGVELTEREKFDAERLSGRSLNEIGNYTTSLIIAYFTLRRAGVALTFDEFLDTSGFEFEAASVPLAAAAAIASEQPNGGDPTETDGTPTTAPSSESTPG